MNIEVKDKAGSTLFLYTTANVDIQTVLFLLGLNIVDIESKDNKGRTPFAYAVRDGNI